MSDSSASESKKERKERKALKKEKEQANVLSKSSKKRAAEEIEELEIDLTEPAPLSKKQKRLLRQGKLTTEQLDKKNKIPKPLVTDTDGEEAPKKAKEKSETGVWIGNLSFDTTKEDLVRFLVGKTSTFSSSTSDASVEGSVKIEESDITRVNLPKKEKKIKGFAYIDFRNISHVKTAISLSEEHLNGRRLLIKDAHSFEGRPKKDPVASLSVNPPSRILFVGNLSFDTTRELLEEHFQSCGEIIKIRMATFEDTGKCKGFAFVDFKNEEGPTKALSNKIYKSLIGRPLRLEFGEDRSKRTPNRRPKIEGEEGSDTQMTRRPNVDREQAATEVSGQRAPRREAVARTHQQVPLQRHSSAHSSSSDMAANQRLKSSVALASAQRASAAIVKSTGKKLTFD